MVISERRKKGLEVRKVVEHSMKQALTQELLEKAVNTGLLDELSAKKITKELHIA